MRAQVRRLRNRRVSWARARWRLVWWTALPLLAAPATAGVTQAPEMPSEAAAFDAEPVVEFTADQVTYDSENEIVTAIGRVRMSSEGNYLAAERVTWNRNTGLVRAEGNVVVVNPEGDRLVGENVELTDTLREGTIENLLVVLESGGRVAAERGARDGEFITLENAAYSPCPVTTGRLPETAELDDHRSPGNLRSGERPNTIPRRPAAALRSHPAPPARVQRRSRWPGGDRLAGPGLQDLAGRTDSKSHCPIIGGSHQTATSP
jgi:hypothetical protein